MYSEGITLPGRTTECNFDGEGLEPCASGRYQRRGLALGEHTLEIVSVNAIGNKNVKSVHWDVVTAKPSVKVAPKMEAAKEISTEGPDYVNNEDELSCNTGTWEGAPTITYSYQWEKNSGSGFEPIADATASTLTTTPALNEDVLRCAVTAKNNYAETSEVSSNTFTALTVGPEVEFFEVPKEVTTATAAEFVEFVKASGESPTMNAASTVLPLRPAGKHTIR